MKKNTRRTRKVRNLIFVCALCAILLTVSTYAWFIGMKTVNVASFDIEIATTEGLFLSMDGENWSYTLDARNADAYTGNTNSWAEDGLIPVSTVGDMDATVSRMKLFEKGSLTTTKGGYRLLTSRVDNYKTNATGTGLNQGEGYVVFDLFIKNLSGNEYYTENNVLNEEAIYLTTNSEVTVSENGVANTGIENSVRVAFAQIGRVEGNTAGETGVKNITDITCSNVEKAEGQVQVTGICRSAQIWEPNDTKHVQNALNWYNTSCRIRKSTGNDVTLAASYDVDSTCTEVGLTAAVPTYAISREIKIADNVDVYDGEKYNTYSENTIESDEYETYAETEDKSGYKLVSFPYFTDTMKDKTGVERPEFMTLAPNSITKVRVYVYIEGQDIDNYDFASLGKQISVKFGFTKERFTEDDVDYEGPSTDITPTNGE